MNDVRQYVYMIRVEKIYRSFPNRVNKSFKASWHEYYNKSRLKILLHVRRFFRGPCRGSFFGGPLPGSVFCRSVIVFFPKLILGSFLLRSFFTWNCLDRSSFSVFLFRGLCRGFFSMVPLWNLYFWGLVFQDPFRHVMLTINITRTDSQLVTYIRLVI